MIGMFDNMHGQEGNLSKCLQFVIKTKFDGVLSILAYLWSWNIKRNDYKLLWKFLLRINIVGQTPRSRDLRSSTTHHGD